MVAIVLRTEFTSRRLRSLAVATRKAKQSRRLLAIAAAHDGMSRAAAAEIGGMDLGSSPGRDAARPGAPVQGRRSRRVDRPHLARRAGLSASATTTTLRCARASSARSHRPRASERSARGGQRRPRPVDQQGAEISVAALGDAEQPLLAAGRVCARRQSHPGRQVPALVKADASPTAATSAVAFNTPTPGISQSRRQSAVCLATAANSSSNAAIRSSNSRPSARNSSIRRRMRGDKGS